MIRNIILFFLLPSLIIAFILSFAGFTQVASGEGFHLWIKSVNSSYANWSFEIPKIPKINLLDTYEPVKSAPLRVVTVPIFNTTTTFKQKFVNFVNFFITLVNGLSAVINILIGIVNILIEVIQFILTMVYCIKDIPQYANIGNDSMLLWWYQNVG